MQLVLPQQVSGQDFRAKESYKAHYDCWHGVHVLCPLTPDQAVHMRVDKEKQSWKKAAKVVNDSGHLYLVKEPDGMMYHRSHRHLLPIPQPLPDAVLIVPLMQIPTTSHLLGSPDPHPPSSNERLVILWCLSSDRKPFDWQDFTGPFDIPNSSSVDLNGDLLTVEMVRWFNYLSICHVDRWDFVVIWFWRCNAGFLTHNITLSSTCPPCLFSNLRVEIASMTLEKLFMF